MIIYLLKYQKIIYFIYSILVLVIFNLHSSFTPVILCENTPLPEPKIDYTSTYLFYTGVVLISLSALTLFYCIAASSNTNYDFFHLFNNHNFITLKVSDLKTLEHSVGLLRTQNEILIKCNSDLRGILEEFEPLNIQLISLNDILDQNVGYFPSSI